MENLIGHFGPLGPRTGPREYYHRIILEKFCPGMALKSSGVDFLLVFRYIENLGTRWMVSRISQGSFVHETVVRIWRLVSSELQDFHSFS